MRTGDIDLIPTYYTTGVDQRANQSIAGPIFSQYLPRHYYMAVSHKDRLIANYRIHEFD